MEAKTVISKLGAHTTSGEYRAILSSLITDMFAEKGLSYKDYNEGRLVGHVTTVGKYKDTALAAAKLLNKLGVMAPPYYYHTNTGGRATFTSASVLELLR